FSGAGISDERTTGGKLFVTNTVLKNNKLSNISIPGAGTSPIAAVLDGLQLVSSSNGSGLSVAAGNSAIIKNSTIAGNFSNGIVVNTVGTEVLVENCVVSNNQIGIGIKSGAPIIRLSNVVVTKNTTGLSAGSGQILSFGNNKISGNATENAPTGMISQQ
ncbi:MAG TPA: right-handed parallel beta-helix repeat-containing protein, partial [Pyrinomonadaceae bacterium]